MTEKNFIGAPINKNLDAITTHLCSTCCTKGALAAVREFGKLEDAAPHNEQGLADMAKELTGWLKRNIVAYGHENGITDPMVLTGAAFHTLHAASLDLVDTMRQRTHPLSRLAYLDMLYRLMTSNSMMATLSKAQEEGYLPEDINDPAYRALVDAYGDYYDNTPTLGDTMHIVEEHPEEPTDPIQGIVRELMGKYSPTELTDKLENFAKALGADVRPDVRARLDQLRDAAGVLEEARAGDKPTATVTNITDKAGIIEVDDTGSDDEIADAVVEGLAAQLPEGLDLDRNTLREALAKARQGGVVMLKIPRK